MKTNLLTLLVLLLPIGAFSQTVFRNDAGQAGLNSGFYEAFEPVNFPAGASGWWHLLDVRHSSVNNNFAMQFAGSFFDQNLYFRKTSNNSGQPWLKVLLEQEGKVIVEGKTWFGYGNTNINGYSWTNAALTTNSIEIVNNNSTVSNSSPTLAFHRFGSGGPQFRLAADGSNVLYLESSGENSARNPTPYGGGPNTYFKKLFIDADLTAMGNVGIGTATPDAKLTVSGGEIKTNNFGNQSGIQIGAEATERPRIGFHASDNSRRFKIEMNSINSDYERLGFFATNGGQSAEQEVFSINKTGNLGLGTPLPVSKLHIAGDEFITIGSYDASNGVKGIQFAGFRDIVPNYFGASIEAVPEWSCCGGYPTGGYPGIKNIALNFNVHLDGGVANSKMTAMSIRPNGYIGIGTTSPSELFTVNGKVKAKEIRVDGSGAPDYVFEEDYKVETLESVESYIKANKHLPEIPSAKEFERDGMAVGEMNRLLLKKIEELTLHLIEQKKDIDQVKADNKILKLELQKIKEK